MRSKTRKYNFRKTYSRKINKRCKTNKRGNKRCMKGGFMKGG